MQISKPVMDAALEAYRDGIYFTEGQVYSSVEAIVTAALEAALSTDAEPVWWLVKTDMGKVIFHGPDKLRADHVARIHGRTAEPLYAAPPAPAVAVKALEWEKVNDVYWCATSPVGTYHTVSLIIEGYGKGDWERSGGDLGIHHKSDKDAMEAEQADYEARIRSALSAQVQETLVKCVDGRLREALIPFAQEADNWHESVPDSHRSLCTEPDSTTAHPGSETAFTVGNLRRAREVLTTLSAQVQNVEGWQEVPPETVIEEATKGKHVLAYEKGRYYNAWLEFEASEGGWLWFDDADSEPNPSHWMPLPAAPAAKQGEAE